MKIFYKNTEINPKDLYIEHERFLLPGVINSRNKYLIDGKEYFNYTINSVCDAIDKKQINGKMEALS